MKPHVLHGVYYWQTYKQAKDAAIEAGVDAPRIVEYERGWAVQLYRSGPYLGTTEEMAKYTGMFKPNPTRYQRGRAGQRRAMARRDFGAEALARQAEMQSQAREYIRRHGVEASRRVAMDELSRAVNDVTYPFGRVGLYAAIIEVLDLMRA